MSASSEKQAWAIIDGLMKDLVGGDSVVSKLSKAQQDGGIDLIRKASGWTFVFQLKNVGDAHAVSYAVENLRRFNEKSSESVIPVVVVPFMGDVGRRLCTEKSISWLDLSGNADIKAPGLRIYVEGKPNLFKSSGRPKNVFAPKSSRIARHLLFAPEKFFTQRELTQETSLDEGLVSRVVREMEKMGLVARNASGAVRPKDPDLLLDAWHEKYDFSKHRILKGFVAERTSDLVLAKLSEFFTGKEIDYAITGLSAAWVFSHYAAFRTSTVYLPELPDDEQLREFGFVKGEKGSNLWLVVPNDKDIFAGLSVVEGTRCVHPIQVYLDLKAHPERAKEAADAIRNEFLTWKPNAE